MNREKILRYFEGIEYNNKTPSEKIAIGRDIRIKYGINKNDYCKIKKKIDNDKNNLNKKNIK